MPFATLKVTHDADADPKFSPVLHMGSSIMGPKIIFVPLCIEVLVKFVSAVQGSAKRQSPGLVNFVPDIAY